VGYASIDAAAGGQKKSAMVPRQMNRAGDLSAGFPLAAATCIDA
jgi:hypothetical protein